MKLNHKILSLFIIGAISVGTTNIFAANIAIVGEKTTVLTKQDAQTVTLKAGDRIKMVIDENFHKNDIAKVDMNGTYGYVSKSDIQLKQIETKILTDGAYLRKEPDPVSEILATLKKNDKVTAFYKYSDWYAIEIESGERGFVYESQIDEEDLYLLERKNLQKLNTWLMKERAAENRTMSDSSPEDSPSENISSENKPVEVVMWSSASKILARGDSATIEDVYTGKSFKIKRTFGTNHADVETLTAKDTEIMKQIWGGFTWERRPVIVHIDGRRLAASMAGMPHAGRDSAKNLSYTWGLSGGYGFGQNLDAVKGNAMSGVCDLHFRGSTKHKDGRISATVDPKHQAAINIAAKYK
ncbi:MAG: hypothetical protein K0S71_243 [Clostridia bacterium]|jgi:hypothetical protein|nr:hypothetical protein [Clostridia bacterium]